MTPFEWPELPEHLLVMGGGYIGLEFGQMFRRFGSKVTIIQRGGQLLSRERILGCAVLGVEGGEIMALLEIAMMGHVSYKQLKEGIFAHPTLAECLNNLFATI